MLPPPSLWVGEYRSFARYAIPTGWLRCDGSALSRTTYQALFNAICRRFVSASSTVTITIATPGVVTWTAHGKAVGTPVVFTTDGALPTGLVAGTTYYIQSVPNANTFTVAATVGGAAIDTTGSQSGTHTATTGVGITIASPAVLTWPDHGLGLWDHFQMRTTGALPTGLTPGTSYYVSEVVDANTFKLAASLGGAHINTSGTQSGGHTLTAGHGDGDGSTTFNLPDALGRGLVGSGSAGSGLTARGRGSKLGAESIAPTIAQLPAHDHPESNANGNVAAGAGATPLYQGASAFNTGLTGSGTAVPIANPGLGAVICIRAVP